MGIGSSTGRGKCSPTGKRALLVSCKTAASKEAWGSSCCELRLVMALLQKLGFCTDQIKCITSHKMDSMDLLRSGSLLGGINWLVDGAKPGDHLLFFFSNCANFQGLLRRSLEEKLINRLPEDATLYVTFDGNLSGAVLDLQHALSCRFMRKTRTLGYLKFGVQALQCCLKGRNKATVLQITNDFGDIRNKSSGVPTLHIPNLLTLAFIYAIECCGSEIRISRLIGLMQESAQKLQESLDALLSMPLPENDKQSVVPLVIRVIHMGKLEVQFGQNKNGDIFMGVAYRGNILRGRVLLTRETRSVALWKAGSFLPTMSSNKRINPGRRILA